MSKFVWALYTEMSFLIRLLTMLPVTSCSITLFIEVKISGWCETIKSAPQFTASSIFSEVTSRVTYTLSTLLSISPTISPTLSQGSARVLGAKLSIYSAISFTFGI